MNKGEHRAETEKNEICYLCLLETQKINRVRIVDAKHLKDTHRNYGIYSRKRYLKFIRDLDTLLKEFDDDLGIDALMKTASRNAFIKFLKAKPKVIAYAEGISIGAIGSFLYDFIKHSDKNQIAKNVSFLTDLCRQALCKNKKVDWLNSVENKLPYPFVETTYELRKAITMWDLNKVHRKIKHKENTDPDSAIMYRSHVPNILTRIAENDFITVYDLGSTTWVLETENSTSRGKTGIRRWIITPKIIINTSVNNDFNYSVDRQMMRSVKNYLRQLSQMQTKFRLDDAEIGKFKRNALDQGHIYVQWSNLLRNEAETVVIIKNFEITAALITINTNCNYPAVIGQELMGAMGALGHVKPGSLDSIMQNPLPRPKEYLKNPSYQHFLTALEMSSKSSHAVRSGERS